MDIFRARNLQKEIERQLKKNGKQGISTHFSLNIQNPNESAYLIFWRIGTDEQDKLFLHGEHIIEIFPSPIQDFIFAIRMHHGHLLGMIIIEVD